MWMTYWIWLFAISAVFVVLERLWPWRREQRVLRRGWLTDVGYLVLNGHFVGAWLAELTRPLHLALAGWATSAGVARWTGSRIAEDWPLAIQFLVALVALDFVQWSVHVLLHRVPLLWKFHKVHHSITELDWAGSFRFHFVEIVVYKTAQYLPLVWLGFDGHALFALAVVGTAWGHFNHANIDIDLGPLSRIFNSPRMHIWHHHDEPGLPPRNFGIILSVWDWIFGTAWLPDRTPTRLGFEAVESYPVPLPRQVVQPFVDAVAGRPKAPRDTTR